MGGRPDLVGGGHIRSTGGWAAVKELRAAMKFQKSDERILGNSDFVESVLASNTEALKRKYDLQSISVAAVGKSVIRGETPAKEKNYTLGL